MCEFYGDKVRKRRKDLGIRLVPLAAAIGVSITMISRYERGLTKRPALETVRRLEKALRVKKGTFFS